MGFAQKTQLQKLKMYVSVLQLTGSFLLCLSRDGEDLSMQNKGFQNQACQRTGNTPQSLSQVAKETEIKGCLRIPSALLVALSEINCHVFLCFWIKKRPYHPTAVSVSWLRRQEGWCKSCSFKQGETYFLLWNKLRTSPHENSKQKTLKLVKIFNIRLRLVAFSAVINIKAQTTWTESTMQAMTATKSLRFLRDIWD